jgi:hypothetical protein
MDVQTIAEITDLPVERIELLKIAVQKEILPSNNYWRFYSPAA